ncbi:PREDICTED: claudin-16-like [Gavialis gangeticus]|uniref:claudin-16-like n=1 Tax=Gavialis gangeticus TaxID=94835 RepID=UPI00092EC6E6|nr:PREDICTED: claudin-16-like [Gavialis gangeticus]
MGVPTAAAVLDVLGMALGGLGLLFFVLCAGTDCWREDAKDPHSSVGLSSRCRGLWSECVFDNVARLWTCDIPTSYLSQRPAVLVTTRALVIVTSLLCIGAMPSLIVGMRCTHLMRGNVRQKYKFTLAAGTLFLLGGLAGTAAVLWYAVDTVQKYRLEVSFGIPGVTYELGYSYWMAVAGTLCTCAAGILLLVANCPRTQTPRRKPPHVPLPPDFQRRGTYL